MCLLLLPGSPVIPCTVSQLLSLLRALWSFLQGAGTFSRWEAGAEEGGSPGESLAVICALTLTVWEQLHSHTQPWPQPPFTFNSCGTKWEMKLHFREGAEYISDTIIFCPCHKVGHK